jgi:hypothetical protein
MEKQNDYSKINSMIDEMIRLNIDRFYIYLSNQFDVLKEKDCVSEYFGSMVPLVSVALPTLDKKNTLSHTCEYKKTSGKNKGAACGKSAKNQNKGKWYCGVLKSDGSYTACMKMVMGREKLASPKLTSVKVSGSSVFNNKLALEKIGEFHVDKIHRIVINKDKHEALGVLNKDNKTFSKLNNEQIKYIESKGLIVKDDYDEQEADDEEEVESREEESSIVETDSDDEV